MTTHFMGLVCNKQGPSSAWGSLSSDLLYAIKGFLEEQDDDADNVMQPMETLRLVNRHWCQWATKATTILNPRGSHVRLERVVDMISQSLSISIP